MNQETIRPLSPAVVQRPPVRSPEITASIAHAIHSGGFAGAEKVLFELASVQARQGDLTVKLIAFLDPEQESNEIGKRIGELGLEVIYFKCGKGVGPRSLLRYAALLRDHGIGLVHSHGYKPTIFHVVSRALGLQRLPVVTTAHGYQRVSAGWKARLYNRLDMFAFSRVDRVVAVSAETERFIKEHNPSARLRVITNGIQAQIPPEGRHPLRAALPARHRKNKIIGTIGRLIPLKNQRLLIDAFADLKRSDACLAIVGEGPLREELIEHWRKALPDLEPAVFPFQHDVLEWMEDFDVFVLPSQTEGLPMVILEAGLLAKPVVASRVGGLPDLIRHGGNGFLFDSGDKAALASLLARLLDGDEGPRLGEALRGDVLRDFDMKTTHRRYLDAYSEVLHAA